MADLTKPQYQVLEIYGRIDGRNQLYWGSPVASAALAEMGLLEKFTPPSVAERPRMKARPFRITDAGRSVLAMQRDGDA